MKPSLRESLVKVLFSWNGSCLSAFSTIKFGEISPLHLLYGRCWLFFVTLINGKPFVAAEVASRPYLRHDQLEH